MVKDGIAVAEFACEHLRKPKIIIFCHSWGTLLGLTMVGRRPDLFYAYVGTGQHVSMAVSEPVSYEMALERAKTTTNNRRALKQLEAIGRPPYSDMKTWMVKQRTIMALASATATRGLPNIFTAPLFAPQYSLRDAYHWFAAFSFSGKALFVEVMSYDLRPLTRFDVPIFVFQGDADMHTPAGPVEDYCNSITAPRKELTLLKGEGHTAVLSMPEFFLTELVSRVRPLTERSLVSTARVAG